MFISKKTSITSRIIATGALSAALLLLGCQTSENFSAPQQDGTLKVTVGLDKVGALAKKSTITLDKLILVLTSNTNDTIRDTSACAGTSTTAQTINRSFTLKPLRTWKVVARVKDVRDSVVHCDSGTSAVLNPAATVNVNLNLASKYTMYTANFLNIPDSISSSVAGTSKQVLMINRLVLKVDGVARVDSSLNYFTPLATHSISFDYVSTGSSHNIQLLVYGPMNSWNTANPLYSDSFNMSIGSGNDSTITRSCNWVGPTTGTGNISVVIGRVGKVTVNNTLPGTVIP